MFVREHRRVFFGGIVVLASAIALILLYPQLRNYYQKLFLL